MQRVALYLYPDLQVIVLCHLLYYLHFTCMLPLHSVVTHVCRGVCVYTRKYYFF